MVVRKTVAPAPDCGRTAQGAGNKEHADVVRVTRNGNIFFFKYYFAKRRFCEVTLERFRCGVRIA
jgi:hypothetical protein